MKEKITKLAKENGYADAEYCFDWQGYKAYSLMYEDFACLGIPKYILTKDEIVRLATPEENKRIFKDSFANK